MKKILLIVLALTLLTGCASNVPETTEWQEGDWILEVPVSAGRVWSFKLPGSCEVEETDNNVYWKFTDGGTIYCTDKIEHVAAEYNEDLDIYTTSSAVSKDFDDKTLTLTSGKTTSVSNLASCLAGGEILSKDCNLYKESRIKKLPEVIDMSDDMAMTSSNLYMPKDNIEALLRVYKSELLCNGTDYIEAWVQDGKLEDIQDTLVAIVLSNGGGQSVESWFSDDDIFYIKAADRIIAAKKLRYNEWYVYSGTTRYIDYMITGVGKVHSDAE